MIKRSRTVIKGALVKDSLVKWQSHLKKKQWEEDDYHGNFSAELFEKWFSKLCTTLEEQYGSCIIYMDGASYHKRILNPVPNTSSVKASIQQWLAARGICCLCAHFEPFFDILC